MPHSVTWFLAVVLLLGGVIFVHELGHFLVAKALRVKVLRFSIGFGPPFLSFRRGETEYWLAYLPLGGYVKMAGDDPRAELAPEDRGRGFLEQAPWKRLLIAAAGPAMNILLPVALFLGIVAAQNGTDTSAPVIGTVVPGHPAERAGLQPGDRILAVTGPQGTTRLRYFSDLQEAVTPHPGETLRFEVERDGQRLPPIAIRTEGDVRTNGLESVRVGVIGITGYYPQARVAPVAAGAAGPVEPFDLVVAVDGKPVANALDLNRLLAVAACKPVDLEVLREKPRPLPGAVLADYDRVRLAGVPSCRGDASSLRVVDPWVSATIAAVEPGTPAAQAGLKRGDEVTAVNGKPVHSAGELVQRINAELGQLLPTTPEHPEPRLAPGTITLADGRTVDITALTRTYEDELTGKPRTVPVLGLHVASRGTADDQGLQVAQVKLERGPVEMVSMAWRATVDQIRNLVLGVMKMFTGEISSKQVGSFIQIIQVTGAAVEQGLVAYLWVVALISANLAVMNLLPVPVLDGGHIAQALLETVTRRPLSIRMREVANVIGLVLLISLMVFAFKNDIVRQLEARKPVAEEPAR
jgi:regulator of sigma E protease